MANISIIALFDQLFDVVVAAVLLLALPYEVPGRGGKASPGVVPVCCGLAFSCNFSAGTAAKTEGSNDCFFFVVVGATLFLGVTYLLVGCCWVYCREYFAMPDQMQVSQTLVQGFG